MGYVWHTLFGFIALTGVYPVPSTASPNTFDRGVDLPALGTTESALMLAYNRHLNAVSADRHSRIFEVPRSLVLNLPAHVKFEVSPRTRRLYRITVSIQGMVRCHTYEAALRRRRGMPDYAEWGTRAYELAWRARGKLPAAHYWLHAYDGKGTQCDVTLGDRA